MGRQLKQLVLLVKKNLVLLRQRKGQVLFEVLLTCLTLLAFSFLRGTSMFETQEQCMKPSSLSDPLHDIWGEKKMIAISPANNNLVDDLSSRMLTMDTFKFSDVTRKVLDSENITDEIKEFRDGNSRYLVVFPTNDKFKEYLKTNSTEFKAAIVFEGDEKNISYSIRYHRADADNIDIDGYWNTERLFLRKPDQKEITSSPYDNTGFAALQRLIDSCILLREGVEYNPAIAIRSVPTPAEKTDPFVDMMFSMLIPVSMLIGAFLITSSIAADIVEEKFSKMREIQRMMGLTDTIMWLSWIIQRSLIIIACSALNATVLMFCGYTPLSDGTVVFVFLLLYYTAHTFFVFFVTSLQRNMKSAPAVMMFLTFLQYLPYIVLEIPHLSRSVKMIVSLLPLSGSSIGLVTIAEWEKIGLGAKWNNLGDSLSVLTAFSISDVMLMLLVDIFIYGFLTW
ncbi:phospholipid-transporting ATPase ABCA1-like [Bolinopsis microptera]|uniref:phospholipid-transporting ATPase ABCA1-like n=1 Tax=Bolinopsis microptera TaxID=2820187 RepID=UPI003079885A